MTIITNNLPFPPLHLADEEGLLAVGGHLTSERLLEAYKLGIFPWYEGDTILWWSPNPRFVLYPSQLIISKSMQKILRSNTFTYTYNKAFTQVIHHCKNSPRSGQQGTWITNEMEIAYNNLHHLGIAISAEAWQGKTLVGGLYGVLLNRVFCGESMFMLIPNASKYAFIKLMQQLAQQGIQLIDCQVHTSHLESLGAVMIPREKFVSYLNP